MEKKICSYETLFAVNGTLSEEDAKAVVEKFVKLIGDNATDVDVNEWGKRRFAYPINYTFIGSSTLPPTTLQFATYRKIKPTPNKIIPKAIFTGIEGSTPLFDK